MATSASSIGGLSSGLDTSTIIAQLMRAEAAPQTRLKTALSREQSSIKSLQELNTKVAALATEAGKLASPTAWQSVKVSSSSELVSAVGTSGAVAGSLSFTVQATARAHQLNFSSSAALTDRVTGSDSTTVQLTLADGSTKSLDTRDGTLGGLVGALNGAGTGLRATTLKLDDGTYRLQVTSAATGAASSFSLAGSDGSPLLGGATVLAGQDAAITVGGDTVHSPSNTFSGVVSGLDITLKPGATAGTAVELTAERDTSAIKSSVKSLVDNLNAAVKSIDSLSSYDATTKTSGALRGETAVRDFRTRLLSSVFPADGSSMADVGVQVDRYGKVVFDEAAFDKAYAADPVALSQKFTGSTTALAGATGGFAARVEAVAKAASNSVDGTLTTAVKSRGTAVTRLQSSIEAWDDKLELRRTTLTRTYTALETALNKLQSQSSWLSGQLGSLSAG